ncbi:hypothetical protein H5410_048395 [Solanum commersonii]|uniref:Transposon MuDR mudrA n=1 Tax=Solanum commersonii TaxID=4109 RepID=A0A9J5XHZ0_SOLCO|nr:hypothetical protein H5410_048395 [Solanum commersonii]
MKMWPETTNPSIEPPKPRKMPGRPGKKRRKSKDEPKKWGELSRKGVKMTCSICKKIGHNKAMCAKYGRGSTSQPTSQENSSQQSCSQTGVRTQSSQQSSVCADTTAVPRTTQTKTEGTGFGVYSNPTTGAQVFNPGTSSEKILHGPTKLKSASPTNIDIGFKPRGLKWKGKDAVGTSQLQQMKANRKNWK